MTTILETIAQARDALDKAHSTLGWADTQRAVDAGLLTFDQGRAVRAIAGELRKQAGELQCLEQDIAARASQKEIKDLVSQHGLVILGLCRLIRRLDNQGATEAAIKSAGVRYLRESLPSDDYSVACALFDYVSDVTGVGPD